MPLVAYLMLQGFKPSNINVQEQEDGQKVVEFSFEDKNGIIKDIAMEYRFSDYSRYFDIIKEVRTTITKSLREHN